MATYSGLVFYYMHAYLDYHISLVSCVCTSWFLAIANLFCYYGYLASFACLVHTLSIICLPDQSALPPELAYSRSALHAYPVCYA